MSSLTKNQHHVPAFYLRLWSRDGNIVSCHDLHDVKHFRTSVDGILARGYFYEEDVNVPDNRIEKLLSRMEGDCAPSFKILADLIIDGFRSWNQEKLRALIETKFTPELTAALKKFAAYQYLRVPGAIEQKRFELQHAVLSAAEIERGLNPGRFVEDGYAYLQERFQELKMIVMVSAGQDFLTSDWPCFDAKLSNDAPLLGEEIGRNPSVVAYIPLTPRIAAFLIPKNHLQGAEQLRHATVIIGTDAAVRNQNTLLIQQADRFVVAKDERPFVFTVAAKRKKQSS